MGLLDKLTSGSRPSGSQYGSQYGQSGAGYGGGGGGYNQQQPPYQQGGYGASPRPPMHTQHGGPSGQSGDDRPLPEGWIKQWDSNYNRHFFVDTKANPPKSVWVHPLDNENGDSKSQQQNYTPPSGPPPSDQRAQWNQPQHPQMGYNQQQPQMYGGYGQQPMMGGGGYGQPMYAQQQQPMYMPQQRGRFGGMGRTGGGMGMPLALGAGAGLLGGALIADGMDNAYDHGYDQGYDQGNDMDGGGGGDMGGDMGGGDMGGGDF